MLAGVGVHVDLVDRGRDQALQGVHDRPVLAGHREDRAVVARVARPVEEVDAVAGRDRLGQPVDDVEPAALGDVRDGFDQHATMLALRRTANDGQSSVASIGTWMPRSRATSIARS